MTEFSAAWCLSIVSQGAKASYIRTQSTQYINFASLRIVEGSAGAVVAASQIKSIETGLFSPRRTASVLAFCTLQSAFLFTNCAIHSTWIH